VKPDLSRRGAFGAKAARDQQLDQALKQELRAMGAPAGDHVDPEMLAAWADGGLDPTAMAMVESHVSNCPRCQSIAGVLARTAPVIAAEPRRAFRIPAWWIPIAAGAAAVTIWMVVPQQREIVTAPPSAPATPVESSPAPETPAPATVAPPARDDRRERAAVAEPAKDKPAKLQDVAPQAKEADALKREQAPRQNAAGAVALAPPTAAPTLQETVRMAPATLEIASPNATRRWRIVTTGVERSEDGGRTWILVRPAAGDEITGGMAPSESICWLIGRSGIVLVSSDGTTFARVPLPEAIDLASVTAIDARSALVIAVDGRRFRTDDAGRTWRQD